MVGHEVREVMESQILESLVSHCKHFGFNLSDLGSSWKGLSRGLMRRDIGLTRLTLATVMRRDWVRVAGAEAGSQLGG